MHVLEVASFAAHCASTGRATPGLLLSQRLYLDAMADRGVERLQAVVKPVSRTREGWRARHVDIGTGGRGDPVPERERLCQTDILTLRGTGVEVCAALLGEDLAFADVHAISYRGGADDRLKLHCDDSDVTVNVCLEMADVEGAELLLCDPSAGRPHDSPRVVPGRIWAPMPFTRGTKIHEK